ncbi:MAG: dodecin family protein [Candidatus Methylomirabilis sp.]|nr:dodecin family protein [Deltaproteobacteria bacterium]
MERQAKGIEIVASSSVSWEDAARVAVARAGKTLTGLLGLRVVGKKAKVKDGKIVEYRIRMRLLFELAPDLDSHL